MYFSFLLLFFHGEKSDLQLMHPVLLSLGAELEEKERKRRGYVKSGFSFKRKREKQVNLVLKGLIFLSSLGIHNAEGDVHP
jgi:hypothetical protein